MLVWMILIAAGVAEPAHAQIETSGFPVAQLDESARVAALGGRSPALETENTLALFSNPALLTAEMNRKLSFSYLNHIGSLNAGWVSYARSLDSLTTVAIGLRYLSFGAIDRADELGVTNGTFSPSDVGLTIGASRVGPRKLRYGVNVHLLLSSIDGTHASSISMDAGAFYPLWEATTVGLTIHHAGFVLSSLGKRSDEMPFDIRLGFTHKMAHMPLLISVTAYRLNKMDGGPDGTPGLGNALYHVLFGSEFQFSRSFQIRFGYNYRRHDELKMKSRLDMAGFSTGVGIRISKIVIDYAFNSWSSLGGLHRFTVQTGL